MSYCNFSTSKFHCYRGENESLPLMEKKKITNSLLVLNGIKSFSYEDIKLRGVDACIGDVKRIIKEGKLGKIYKEVFNEVDEQYFTENDYGMLAACFDQFMKDTYEILNPKPKEKPPIYGISSSSEKKSQLGKKRIDLSKQIKEMQEDLKRTEEESSKIDLEAINLDISDTNGGIYTKVPGVSI